MVSINNIKFPWDNQNHVVRYCASRLSIPRDAISVDAIYVENRNTNDNANMEYGYTYIIHKANNIHPIRKFELEINHYKYMNKDFLSSYLKFTNHYNDEIFPPEQILLSEPNHITYDMFGIDFTASDDKSTSELHISTNIDSNYGDSDSGWHVVGKKGHSS